MSIWLRHSFTRPSEGITSYLSPLYIIAYKDLRHFAVLEYFTKLA
jgi:hypothetical protein